MKQKQQKWVWEVARPCGWWHGPCHWLGKIIFLSSIFVFSTRISSKSSFFCSKTQSIKYSFL